VANGLKNRLFLAGVTMPGCEVALDVEDVVEGGRAERNFCAEPGLLNRWTLRSPSSAPATAALSSFAVTWPPWQKPWRLFLLAHFKLLATSLKTPFNLVATVLTGA
jgi:hypothetical protein